MQQALFRLYINIVQEYYERLQLLYSQVEMLVRMTEFTHHGTHFTPTEVTIFQQIRHLPREAYDHPPVAWVEPNRGILIYEGDTWDYAFHGGGLSFFEQASERDISGEFARTGELAITEYTTSLYFAGIPTKTPDWRELSIHNELYFEEMKTQKIVYPVPPFFEGDDNTYIVRCAPSA